MNCELDISVCNTTETKKCQNGGRCVDGFGATYTCDCQDGWTGLACEENVNECLDNPCLNGGMCMDLPGDFFCSCPFGFAGDVCEVELER